MPSSAEAAAYIRWRHSHDDASRVFVSWRTRLLAGAIRFFAPKRFERIVERRGSLSQAMAWELAKHPADTIIDLGAGYNTLGLHWKEDHPKGNFIEVDAAVMMRRKKRLLQNRGPLLIGGDLRCAATYQEVAQHVKGKRAVILLEGVLSYLSARETDATLTGVDSLLQKRRGVLITHRSAPNEEWSALRMALWGKREETDVVAALSRHGWRVRSKQSREWALIVAEK